MANSSAASQRRAALRQRAQDSAVVLVDDAQQDERRAVRFAVAAFPMPQGAKADAELGRELLLREPDALPQSLHVYFGRRVSLYAFRPAAPVRNGFTQSLFDACKCFTHVVNPMPFYFSRAAGIQAVQQP